MAESLLPTITEVAEHKQLSQDCLALKAQLTMERGDAKLSLDLVSSTIRENPAHLASLLVRAKLYLKQGEVELAERDFVLAADENKEHPIFSHASIQFNMGLAYFENKHYEKALVYFQEAYAKSPTELRCKHYLFLSYYHLQEWDKALTLADELLLLHGDDWSAYTEEAVITRFNRLMLLRNKALSEKNLAAHAAIVAELGEWILHKPAEEKLVEIVKDADVAQDLLFYLAEFWPTSTQAVQAQLLKSSQSLDLVPGAGGAGAGGGIAVVAGAGAGASAMPDATVLSELPVALQDKPELKRNAVALNTWLYKFKSLLPTVFSRHDALGRNVFHVACATANLELTDWCFNNLNAQQNADLLLQRDAYQHFPLHYAIIQQKTDFLWDLVESAAEKELLPAAVQGSFKSHIRDIRKNSFLFWCQSSELAHCAAREVDANLLSRLAAVGVDMNLPDAVKGLNPLAHLAQSRKKTPEQRKELFARLIDTVSFDFVSPLEDLTHHPVYKAAGDDAVLASFIAGQQQKRKSLVEAVIGGFLQAVREKLRIGFDSRNPKDVRANLAFFGFVARWLHTEARGDWQQVAYWHGASDDSRLAELGKVAADSWLAKYTKPELMRLVYDKFSAHLRDEAYWPVKLPSHFKVGLRTVLFDLQVSSPEARALLTRTDSGPEGLSRSENGGMLKRYFLNYFIQSAYCPLIAIAKGQATSDVTSAGTGASAVAAQLDVVATTLKSKDTPGSAISVAPPGLPSFSFSTNTLVSMVVLSESALNLAVYFYKKYRAAEGLAQAERFHKLFEKMFIEDVLLLIQQGMDRVIYKYQRQINRVAQTDLPALAEVMVKRIVDYITQTSGSVTEEKGVLPSVSRAFRSAERHVSNWLGGRQVAAAPNVLKALDKIFIEALYSNHSSEGRDVTLGLTRPVNGQRTWNALAMFQRAGIRTAEGRLYFPPVTDAEQKKELGEYDRRYDYCEGDEAEVYQRGLRLSPDLVAMSEAPRDHVTLSIVMLRGGLAREDAAEAYLFSEKQTTFIRFFVDYFFHGAYCSLMAIARGDSKLKPKSSFLSDFLDQAEAGVSAVSGTTTLPVAGMQFSNQLLVRTAIAVGRYYIDYYSVAKARKFSKLFDNWDIDEVVMAIKRGAELIAYKYADQINALRDVSYDIKPLAHVAVTRIVEHIVSRVSSTETSTATWAGEVTRYFKNAFWGMQIPGFQSIQKPLYEVFINGLINPDISFGNDINVNARILDAERAHRLGEVVTWKAAGVFKWAGVETSNGARYRRSEFVAEHEVSYGYCRGDVREVYQRGLAYCARPAANLIKMSPPVLSLAAPVYPKEASHSAGAEAHIIQRPLIKYQAGRKCVILPLAKNAVDAYLALCLFRLLQTYTHDQANFDRELYQLLGIFNAEEKSIMCEWIAHYDGTSNYLLLNPFVTKKVNTVFRDKLISALMTRDAKAIYGTYRSASHAMTSAEFQAAAEWMGLKIEVLKSGVSSSYAPVAAAGATVELIELDATNGIYQLMIPHELLPNPLQIVEHSQASGIPIVHYKRAPQVREQVLPLSFFGAEKSFYGSSIQQFLLWFKSQYADFKIIPLFQSASAGAAIEAVYTRLALVRLDKVKMPAGVTEPSAADVPRFVGAGAGAGAARVEASSKAKREEMQREQAFREIETEVPIELSELFARDKEEKASVSTGAHHVFLEGVAGTGKTTLSKYLVHEWATGRQLQQFAVVLRISLRELLAACEYRRFASEAMVWCWATAWPEYGATIINQWLSELASSNQPVLYVLDGWDEVADSTNEELMRLVKFFFAKPYVLLTSRPRVVSEFKAERCVRTLGYLDEDVVAYVDRYVTHYAPEQSQLELERRVTQLLSTLDERPRLLEMAQTPVLLEMMCWLYLSHGVEQFQVEQLSYSYLYHILFEKLVARYLSKSESTSSAAATDRKEECKQIIKILERIAYTAMAEGVKQLSYSLLKKVFDALSIPEARQSAVLKELLSLGLLQSTAKSVSSEHNEYYFIHLSFQEYLAACYWSSQFRDPSVALQDRARREFKQYKHSKSFEWVWRFSAGVLRLADTEAEAAASCNAFFDLMVEEPRMVLSNHESFLILRCWDEIGRLASFDHQEALEKWLIHILLFYERRTGANDLESVVCHSSYIKKLIAQMQALMSPSLDPELSLYRLAPMIKYLPESWLRQIITSKTSVENLPFLLFSFGVDTHKRFHEFVAQLSVEKVDSTIDVRLKELWNRRTLAWYSQCIMDRSLFKTMGREDLEDFDCFARRFELNAHQQLKLALEIFQHSGKVAAVIIRKLRISSSSLIEFLLQSMKSSSLEAAIVAVELLADLKIKTPKVIKCLNAAWWFLSDHYSLVSGDDDGVFQYLRRVTQTLGELNVVSSEIVDYLLGIRLDRPTHLRLKGEKGIILLTDLRMAEPRIVEYITCYLLKELYPHYNPRGIAWGSGRAYYSRAESFLIILANVDSKVISSDPRLVDLLIRRNVKYRALADLSFVEPDFIDQVKTRLSGDNRAAALLALGDLGVNVEGVVSSLLDAGSGGELQVMASLRALVRLGAVETKALIFILEVLNNAPESKRNAREVALDAFIKLGLDAHNFMELPSLVLKIRELEYVKKLFPFLSIVLSGEALVLINRGEKVMVRARAQIVELLRRAYLLQEIPPYQFSYHAAKARFLSTLDILGSMLGAQRPDYTSRANLLWAELDKARRMNNPPKLIHLPAEASLLELYASRKAQSLVAAETSSPASSAKEAASKPETLPEVVASAAASVTAMPPAIKSMTTPIAAANEWEEGFVPDADVALASQRSVVHIKVGEMVMPCKVVPAAADGDCGFTAIRHALLLQDDRARAAQFNRESFIALVGAVYAAEGTTASLKTKIEAMFRADRVTGLEDWQRVFKSSGYWLADEHLRFVSEHFKLRFKIYCIDSESNHLEPEKTYEMVDESLDAAGIVEISLAHLCTQMLDKADAWLNHFEAIVINPDAASLARVAELSSEGTVSRAKPKSGFSLPGLNLYGLFSAKAAASATESKVPDTAAAGRSAAAGAGLTTASLAH